MQRCVRRGVFPTADSCRSARCSHPLLPVACSSPKFFFHSPVLPHSPHERQLVPLLHRGITLEVGHWGSVPVGGVLAVKGATKRGVLGAARAGEKPGQWRL